MTLKLRAALFAWGALALPAASSALEAQEPGALARVDSIAVKGIQRLSRAEVTSAIGFSPGSRIGWLDAQRGIKALWATQLYDDVEMRMEESGGRNTLVISVTERPMVRTVRITGLESISADDVQTEAGLEENQTLSRRRIAFAAAYIRDELRSEGVPFARVGERVLDVPDRAGWVDVLLEVEEGQRITIAEVEFSGNERFEDEDLRGALTTKPEGFFWFRSGDYDEMEFEADLLESLPVFYDRSGFLDFQVLGDTLLVDQETGKARIEVRVDEGPQYFVDDFEVVGASAFDEERLESLYQRRASGLLSLFGLGEASTSEEGGRVFDLVEFEEAAAKVRELYRNEGYLYAQVIPDFQRVGDESEHRVRATWRIDEGRQAFVNRVLIQGNDFTYDRVIREKVYLLPGDVYSESRVLQSYQNIQSLGFFETPLPQPDIRPQPATGDVDIVFRVVEKSTGSINFGTAMGGGVGLSGFLGYDQPNLFGQAKAGSIRWDFGRYINSFTLSVTDPALFRSAVSGSFSLYNSTDRFFQFATGRRRRMGFGARFGIPFPGSLRTRVFAGYSLSRTSYELFRNVEDRSLFGLPPGTLSSVSLGVTRQTLNHPIFATSGAMLTWNSELNGAILGGDGRFSKHTARAQWLIPVGQLGGTQGGPGGVQFAMGLGLEAGALFGDASRFPFESFWMGGVQFGQALRGYDETSITPRGYFPERGGGIAQIDRLGNAYFSATAEYKAVIGSNIGISAFLDAGSLWDDPRHLNVSRLYRGAGIGVQLVTPFGPIGVDYAYGFDRTEPGWQWHFKMGPNF